MDQETRSRFEESMLADVNIGLTTDDFEEEQKYLKAIKLQQEILDEERRLAIDEKSNELKEKELNLKEKELEDRKTQEKKDSIKDIVVAVVPAALKFAGLIIVCSITKKVIGSEMMMTYQDNMIPSKGMNEGGKFLENVALHQL